GEDGRVSAEKILRACSGVSSVADYEPSFNQANLGSTYLTSSLISPIPPGVPHSPKNMEWAYLRRSRFADVLEKSWNDVLSCIKEEKGTGFTTPVKWEALSNLVSVMPLLQSHKTLPLLNRAQEVVDTIEHTDIPKDTGGDYDFNKLK